MSLDGSVVVLTGSAGALGSALARRFAEVGCAVVLSDVNRSALDTQVAGLGKEFPSVEVTSLSVDVGDPQQMENLIQHAQDAFGRVDVMINNAGVLNSNGRIHNLPPEDWQKTIHVNLMGAVNGIASAVRSMRPRGVGSIINTASAAGLTAWPYASAYGATKAAVIHLTRIAAVEYARDGIRVNCVCPGTFRSAIHDGLPEEAMEAMAVKHPLGLGSPADLTDAYLYLAGDGSKWTTGSALVVDGGYSAP
ncbi:MAG: SDR family oxidoreductase [Acidimicrobiales bacterium]|nr:SDR family oxidoreductase [Acidimicrobiales bacterium]